MNIYSRYLALAIVVCVFSVLSQVPGAQLGGEDHLLPHTCRHCRASERVQIFLLPINIFSTVLRVSVTTIGAEGGGRRIRYRVSLFAGWLLVAAISAPNADTTLSMPPYQHHFLAAATLSSTPGIPIRAGNRLSRSLNFHNREAPTGAFSWMIAPTSAFTFKILIIPLRL